MQNSRVLLPRAAKARMILPDKLRAMGAVVDDIAVYKTRLDPSEGDLLKKALSEGTVDMVTFTSSSTAENFVALLKDDDFHPWLDKVTLASIGPITSDTAAKLGLKIDVTADEYTIPGLIESILANCGDPAPEVRLP
jgi:uroporphyrinogen III methyltransferase/synthase